MAEQRYPRVLVDKQDRIYLDPKHPNKRWTVIGTHYCTILQGADSETEITILRSFGQNGLNHCMMTLAACDGTIVILSHPIWINPDKTEDWINDSLPAWWQKEPEPFNLEHLRKKISGR